MTSHRSVPRHECTLSSRRRHGLRTSVSQLLANKQLAVHTSAKGPSQALPSESQPACQSMFSSFASTEWVPFCRCHVVPGGAADGDGLEPSAATASAPQHMPVNAMISELPGLSMLPLSGSRTKKSSLCLRLVLIDLASSGLKGTATAAGTQTGCDQCWDDKWTSSPPSAAEAGAPQAARPLPSGAELKGPPPLGAVPARRCDRSNTTSNPRPLTPASVPARHLVRITFVVGSQCIMYETCCPAFSKTEPRYVMACHSVR